MIALRFSLLLLALLLSAAAAAPARGTDSATTVIIVRHAEKDTAKTDPALTAAGRARARGLARLLGSAGLVGVIASDRLRTLETAAAVARDHGLGIDTLAREGTVEDYAARAAGRIAAAYAGKSLLVVSHSDIIPALLKALGIGEPVDIPDSVYDDLFIVTLRSGGRSTLLRLKYGPPTE